jgi:hypothetical protein
MSRGKDGNDGGDALGGGVLGWVGIEASAVTLRYGTPAAVGQGVFTAAAVGRDSGGRGKKRYREEVGIFVSFSN